MHTYVAVGKVLNVAASSKRSCELKRKINFLLALGAADGQVHSAAAEEAVVMMEGPMS
jgi:hypothetical protein